MWFRVELNKDGSVSKCESVEARSKGTGRVFYVDAETPIQACRMAGALSARGRRAEWLRAGLCTRCGKARDTDGKSCSTCIARMGAAQARKKLRAAGHVVPVPPRHRQDTTIVRQMRAELPLLERIADRYNTNRSGFGKWLGEELRRYRAALGVLGKKAS